LTIEKSRLQNHAAAISKSDGNLKIWTIRSDNGGSAIETDPRIGLASSTSPYDPVHSILDAAIVEESIGKFRPRNLAAAISNRDENSKSNNLK